MNGLEKLGLLISSQVVQRRGVALCQRPARLNRTREWYCFKRQSACHTRWQCSATGDDFFTCWIVQYRPRPTCTCSIFTGTLHGTMLPAICVGYRLVPARTCRHIVGRAYSLLCRGRLKCGSGKNGSGNIGTILQGWKMRELEVIKLQQQDNL